MQSWIFNRITYFEDRWPGQDYLNTLGAWCRRTGASPPPPLAWVVGEVTARVNHSRWIVECPDCRGAQDASRDYLLFYCPDCGNARNQRAWRAVVFPEYREQIEAALMARARIEERNWQPGEVIS